MLKLLSKLKPLFYLFISFAILALSAGMYFFYLEIGSLKETKPYKNRGNLIYWEEGDEKLPDLLPSGVEQERVEVGRVTNLKYTFSDCNDCEEKVQEMIDKSFLVPSSNSTSNTVIVVPKQAQTQTSYVPLGSVAASTSTDWYTIENASAFIDLANDFTKEAYITFETSLKVQHGNGQAFARLWDDTSKIAVNGSELSTSNNFDYEHVKSDQLYLWNGNNNYKVQVKSLNGYEVTVSDAKVKVVY